MIDEELVITVRIRVPQHTMSHLEQVGLAGAISGGVVSAFTDLPGTLTGIEFTLPTYESYQEVPRPDPPATTSP
jgi:hypothetical protein